jgi:adenylate cyclase
LTIRFLNIKLSKGRSRLFAGLLIAVAIGLICSLLSYFQLFHNLSEQTGDLLYRGQNSDRLTDSAGKIVVVAIDDSSLAELGRFSSWPRSFHTRLINILSESGARIIAFDILFSEPSPDDEELAEAIRKSGNVILARADITGPGQVNGGENNRPLPDLEESALATGHAFMVPDDDGVVRKLPVILPRGDQYEPSLALTAVAKYLRRPQVFDSPPDEKLLTMAGREIPLQSHAMLINYLDDPSSARFEKVSYADVLRGTVSPATFQDKIVIIGVTALGFGDSYWTPMGQALSGVEIHAQAMNTILSGSFIRSAPPSITYASILLLAIICGLVALRSRVIWSALGAVSLGAIYFLTAFYYFGHGLLLNVFYPPLSLAAVFLGVNIFNVASERTEKREITNTFGRYVSPSVAANILKTVNEGSLKLGGKEYPVTVLFADVRNFTGFCEKNAPQVVVSTLNRYLSVIIGAVFEFDGMVNKFGGDSIMAVWNAPVDCPEHALFATRAAIKAQQEISILRSKSPHLPKMEFGIGVNTGTAIAGNMGSLDRLEYSVIGDTVNTTARLTAVVPGGKVWIGAETFEQVKHQFEVLPLEPLALKGKGEMIQAYEVSYTIPSASGELSSVSIKP